MQLVGPHCRIYRIALRICGIALGRTEDFLSGNNLHVSAKSESNLIDRISILLLAHHLIVGTPDTIWSIREDNCFPCVLMCF